MRRHHRQAGRQAVGNEGNTERVLAVATSRPLGVVTARWQRMAIRLWVQGTSRPWISVEDRFCRVPCLYAEVSKSTKISTNFFRTQLWLTKRN